MNLLGMLNIRILCGYIKLIKSVELCLNLSVCDVHNILQTSQYLCGIYRKIRIETVQILAVPAVLYGLTIMGVR